MEIKNLRRVSQRIKKAIKQKERIILYADADLDGVTSLICLKEAILNLGGKISAIYFPQREKEGYGLNEKALNKLKKFSPALLITLDLGISNFKEAKLAKKMGFELIIIDHHQVLDKLPKASIIVDPEQKDDLSNCQYLATVGIVFKLIEILFQKNLPSSLRKNFLELVALGTLADMMPKKEENKIFIEEGLSLLENSFRPGIKAFLESQPFKSYQTIDQKVSKLISVLNVRETRNSKPIAFRLLSTPSLKEAKKIISILLKKDKLRREKINRLKEKIEAELTQESEPIIFKQSSKFDLTLTGVIASILVREYQKPVFLVKKMKKESLGTVRTPKEVDSVGLMKKCRKLLISYGGHSQASGFRIKNNHII